MKTLFFFFAAALIFVSCGPSPEEMKKMKGDADRTFDSIVKAAEKKIADSHAVKDTLKVSDTASIKK